MSAGSAHDLALLLVCKGRLPGRGRSCRLPSGFSGLHVQCRLAPFNAAAHLIYAGIGRGFYGKVYVLFAKQGGKWGKIACYMMLFSCGYAIISQTPKVIPHGSAVSRLPSMPPLICIPAAVSFHSRKRAYHRVFHPLLCEQIMDGGLLILES